MPDNTINPDENESKESPENSENSSGIRDEHTDKDQPETDGEESSVKEDTPDSSLERSPDNADVRSLQDSEESPVISQDKPAEEDLKPALPDTEKAEVPVIPKSAAKAKSADSDNRISLIDKNNLQILVSTKNGVRVNTVVKDKATASEVQSDEIFLPPKNDFGIQEAEIRISIFETPREGPEAGQSEAEQHQIPEDQIEEGRFTPRLIDENLQKVKFELLHGESVRIDYDFRDKKTSANAKRYKNYLSAKEREKVFEVEVTVSVEVPDVTSKDMQVSDEQGRVMLIPNPEVAELIQPPIPIADYSQGGYFEDGTYRNPFDSLRALIRRNTTIGISVAVVLHLIAAAYAFYSISKKPKDVAQEEQQRLIVIQDLPDPKIRLENIEDPNKPPPVEEKDLISIPPKRTVPPRKVVQPPKVNRPENKEEPKDTTLTALSKELDSLRRLGDSLLASDTSKLNDTTKAFFDIPDSLRNNFSENDIGLGMYFPNNWKLIDEREINKNETMFRGVLLTDTTALQPGTMTIFIHLDKESKGFNSEDFTTEFQMIDTNLMAFAKPPETQAAHTKYEFYVLNKIGTEKFSVKAEVRKEFFDKYKNEIEAVVRSINIKRKEDINKSSLDGNETNETEEKNPEGQ
jgi:hypothetical protein